MAVDMFLILDGIDGESKDKAHENKIDVIAWSWGMSQTGTGHVGGGSGAGKVSVQDLNVTKYVDFATPKLMKHCCNGKHIPKGKLIVRKAGENPLEYIVIELEDILVAGISKGGSGGEERLTENVSLNFAKFKYTYKQQSKSGGVEKEDECGWDIEANAPK